MNLYRGGVPLWHLAFDPARESEGLVDLSAAADVKLLRVAGHSWMPRRR